MGSGSLEGASRPWASHAPDASSGDAAQYCKNRRRLVARMVDGVMVCPPCQTFFLWEDDSSGIGGQEGSARSSPGMQSAKTSGVHGHASPARIRKVDKM